MSQELLNALERRATESFFRLYAEYPTEEMKWGVQRGIDAMRLAIGEALRDGRLSEHPGSSSEPQPRSCKRKSAEVSCPEEVGGD